MWNPNWKRNLTIRFGSTGGALSTLNCRQCDPPLVWFSFQASYVDWWCCCFILCPVNCLFAHFFTKQHLQISNYMWIKRTRWAILGQLQVCHGMGSFAAFSINRCYTRTYSIRIMPFFVWHSNHIRSLVPNSYDCLYKMAVTTRFFDDFCTFSRGIFEIPHCWGQSRGKRLHSSPSCIWLSKAKTHFLSTWSNLIVSESGWGY